MPRGGKREGAGRPAGAKNLRTMLGKDLALGVLEKVDVAEQLRSLVTCADLRIKFETIKFLCEQAYGKAAQTIDQTVKNPDGSAVNQGIKIIAVMPDHKEVEIASAPAAENKVHKVM
jgi:hypothetical protein